MISYEIYKVVHILCILLVVGALGAQFFSDKTPKYMKIIGGVASLLIMVTGMGLIARIGIGHGTPWPLWIKMKFGMWLLIAALGPIMAKKLVSKKQYGFLVMMILFLVTITIAVTKLA